MTDLKIIIVDDGANTHSPNPPCDATVAARDTVSFQNLMDCEVKIITDPGLFQGGSVEIKLAPGEISADYKATGAAGRKKYHYQDCSMIRAPRSGTIDIS